MIPYGKMFYSGEVVLVYIQDEPAFFARVEQVTADVKKSWWHLTFTILTVPLDTLTWTLDDDQMRGQQFTMNQVPIRIERVEAPAQFDTIDDEPMQDEPDLPDEPDFEQNSGSNIVSLFGDE